MEQSVRDILSTIDDAIAKFQDAIPGIQKLVYDELQPLIKNFEIKDGRLLNNINNLKLIGDLKNKLEKIIISADYKKSVQSFIDSFSAVSNLQLDYFKQFNKEFTPKKTLPFIKQLAVEATINGLMGQGMSASVIDPIQKILNQNITTGGSYAAFQDQLRNHILTNDTGEGTLERYTKQITTDAINQYNAQYHEAIAQDLQFNWGQYVGSNITTSREFCIYLTKKRWVHKSELPEILRGHIGNEQCKLSKTTGLPLGMIPGTNPDNFKVLRGGYNCGHQFFWVPDSSVPDDVKKLFSSPVTPIKVEGKQPQPASSEKVQGIKDANEKTIAEYAKKGIPFFDDIAEHWDPEIKLFEISKGASHFAPSKKAININTETDRLNNDYYKQKIMIHEGAHAMHFNKKIVTYDQTDKDFDTFFKSAKSIINGKASQMENDLNAILRKSFGDQTVTEQVLIYLDTLGGLTKGRYGAGHKISYYKDGNMGKMEVFAHAITLAKMDNAFSNESEAIKELTDLMKEYGLKVLQSE